MCFLHRWSKLKAALVAKRNKLGESQSLQQFNRDADEVDTWMMEKMQTASDESYKDPTNLQVSVLDNITTQHITTNAVNRENYKNIKLLRLK